MSQVLLVDDLSFQIKRSPRRHTLELIVDRGGELVIAAPAESDEDSMAAFVREMKFWLYRKLAEKESKQQPAGGKEFVSGEAFPYLGRSYRLLLVKDQEAALRMANGRFLRRSDRAPQGRVRPSSVSITQLAPHRAGLNGGLVHTYRLSHGVQRHPVPERPLPV